jgi:uncharacterized membrane protein HdeD (DUF308 family)
MINAMLLGAIAVVSFILSLFFLRFWKATRDRFFLFFALSFFIEGCSRIMLGWSTYSSEQEPLFYIIRLFSFILILFAIIDKNWIRRKA